MATFAAPPAAGGLGAAKKVSEEDEAAILAERELLTPTIPPGAVVLSEATPIAYYLDDVLSGENA